MTKVFVVIGTRPEAIKMAPLINKLKNNNEIKVAVCVTAQHREMLDQILEIFEIKPEYDLDLMSKSQTLEGVSSKIIANLTGLIKDESPDWVLVHGDTTTSFAAALAAYYAKCKVAHVEAGLRTNDINSPWPEEGNRQLTSRLASLHFAPTNDAHKNLLNEGVEKEKIYVTGNTVVDALKMTVAKIGKNEKIQAKLKEKWNKLDSSKKLVLVTAHRRENFGEGIQNICKALRRVAQRGDVEILYPVHPNPNIKECVINMLHGKENIHLTEPLDYIDFVYLMTRCHMILTDSGGIQEEAPSLKKPVLVLRNVTERPEAVMSGAVKVIGTNEEDIVKEVSELVEDINRYRGMVSTKNPYGDGESAGKIIGHLIAHNVDSKL